MRNKVVIGVCMSLILLSGCWDSKELNERAIWLATGWDVAKDGHIEVSGQIIIPSNVQSPGDGGGGSGQGFYVTSAKGKNIGDVLKKLQAKLPREAFFGQRRVIFLGEEFAKRGLEKELDDIGRNSSSPLRTDLFVVKGGTAKDILTVENPLEKSPVFAALKEHRQSGGRGDTSFLKFIIAANRDGIRPSLPVIAAKSSIEGTKSGKAGSPNPKIVGLAGVSVFDQNLKMLGYLDTEENRNLLWVMGELNKMTISTTKEGKASINLTEINSKIEPTFNKDNQIHFTVTLKGEGALEDSNSGIDLRNTKSLKLLERQFEREAKKQVQRTIRKVQKIYRVDIFGFGEAVHRENPVLWDSLKNNWDETFSEKDIAVKVHIKIKQIGMDGPSLLFKESEIKR